ncbi:hypothetical protein HMPREF3213_02010 [Heyndrickxia coagulans]|uniref:Uncharacterized protein n=1 Tax=Heyndrickxia coagulans TaxID=1398 RepID=A0A133KPF6_HEYCO|nr:hypothetical protein HMPREF3213_02010 [Heyndrickxia coagulans]
MKLELELPDFVVLQKMWFHSVSQQQKLRILKRYLKYHNKFYHKIILLVPIF